MKYIAFLLLSCAFVSCGAEKNIMLKKPSTGKIPLGTFKYKIYLNQTNMGDAVFTTSLENGKYISKQKMQLSMLGFTTNVNEYIEETEDFKPVSYIYETELGKNGEMQKHKLTAAFEGKKITVTSDFKTETYMFDREFHIGTNFLSSRILANGISEGASSEDYIYDPSSDEENLIRISEKITGKEKAEYDGSVYEFYKSLVSFGAVKNMENYCDSAGVSYVIKFTILSAQMRLVLVK
jgi:hypothetical protein